MEPEQPITEPAPDSDTSGQPDRAATPGKGTVVLAGGTGFIGSYLTAELEREGYHVLTVGRGRASASSKGGGADIRWADTSALAAAVDGAAMVINLAGKSVNGRHTAKFRREFLRSRIDATTALGAAIRSAAVPPPLWINASGAAYYASGLDGPQTESADHQGTGFLAEVTRKWEGAFYADELPGTRRVAMRMGVVLGRGGGVAVPFLLLTKLGAGGPQHDGWWFTSKARREAGTDHRRGPGDGSQKVAWVHRRDVLGVIRFVRDTPELSGSINVTAPQTVDNRTFMATFRRVLNRRIGLPAYRWMLEPATLVMRTEASLLLDSVWLVPERLTEAGYTFAYPQLEEAVREIA